MTDRVQVAIERLNITPEVAEKIVARDVETCEAVEGVIRGAWEMAPEGSCCRPDSADNEYQRACVHLRRFWDARAYLELARVGAPSTGAFPCDCRGTGKYFSGGAVVNGQYTGTAGTCYRCGGKGWQTESDRKRNAYYDNHVRRIPGV